MSNKQNSNFLETAKETEEELLTKRECEEINHFLLTGKVSKPIIGKSPYWITNFAEWLISIS